MTTPLKPPIPMEIKFAPPTNPNALNKLDAYLGISSQENISENETTYTKVHEIINKLREMIANNPEHHAEKLQKSYSLLEMQPRYNGESDDEFQVRLNKAIPAFSADKENSQLRFSNVLKEDAYIYLSKYTSRFNPVYSSNNEDLETEQGLRLTR